MNEITTEQMAKFKERIVEKYTKISGRCWLCGQDILGGNNFCSTECLFKFLEIYCWGCASGYLERAVGLIGKALTPLELKDQLEFWKQMLIQFKNE